MNLDICTEIIGVSCLKVKALYRLEGSKFQNSGKYCEGNFLPEF